MAADIIGPWVADIHLLTVLAETRSFTQAARRLGLSKASVSMRIGALERAAGVPLVQRTTRSVVLTDAGRELVADAAPAFERIDAGFTAVKDLSGTPRGTVRVTAPVALGRQHIAPRLAAFFRSYPDVRIHLDLTDRFVNLAQEGYDLAIRHTAAAPESYVAWPLCETRSLLVVAPPICAGAARPGTRVTWRATTVCCTWGRAPTPGPLSPPTTPRPKRCRCPCKGR